MVFQDNKIVAHVKVVKEKGVATCLSMCYLAFVEISDKLWRGKGCLGDARARNEEILRWKSFKKEN